jgi:hypothetical protein
MKAIKSLIKWVVGLFAGIMLIGILAGQSSNDTKKVSESRESTSIPALSFTFPDQNANAVLACVTPGKRDGYNWFITSIDGENKPVGKNLYYNWKNRSGKVDPKSWTEVDIHSNNKKIGSGDAFMLTAFQLKDTMKQAGIQAAVFVVADSIEEAKKATVAGTIGLDKLVFVSAKTMTESPCAKMN